MSKRQSNIVHENGREDGDDDEAAASEGDSPLSPFLAIEPQAVFSSLVTLLPPSLISHNDNRESWLSSSFGAVLHNNTEDTRALAGCFTL